LARAVTVLVVGAQGALGRMCADALREAGFDVLRAGRRPEDRPDFRFVELDDSDSVARAFSGVDLVVSTVRHPGHAAERFVMREGGVLLNVASLSSADRGKLKAEQGPTRGLVVLHAGVLPGVGSLALKQMLAEHPEADGVEIAACFSTVQSSGAGGTADFAYPALTSARRHPTRVIDFPPPVGRRRCMEIGGPEIGFFGELADGRTGRVYFTVLQRPVQAELLALNATGLLARLPMRLFQLGRGWTARRTTREPKRDVLAVTRGGTSLAAASIQGEGDYLMTAAATTVFARAALDRRSVDPTLSGVVGAEEIFDLRDLQDELERGGIELVTLPV
jgi:NAD dependent epimerase/dehydratase family